MAGEKNCILTRTKIVREECWTDSRGKNLYRQWFFFFLSLSNIRSNLLNNKSIKDINALSNRSKKHNILAFVLNLSCQETKRSINIKSVLVAEYSSNFCWSENIVNKSQGDAMIIENTLPVHGHLSMIYFFQSNFNA